MDMGYGDLRTKFNLPPSRRAIGKEMYLSPALCTPLPIEVRTWHSLCCGHDDYESRRTLS